MCLVSEAVLWDERDGDGRDRLHVRVTTNTCLSRLRRWLGELGLAELVSSVEALPRDWSRGRGGYLIRFLPGVDRERVRNALSNM